MAQKFGGAVGDGDNARLVGFELDLECDLVGLAVAVEIVRLRRQLSSLERAGIRWW